MEPRGMQIAGATTVDIFYFANECIDLHKNAAVIRTSVGGIQRRGVRAEWALSGKGLFAELDSSGETSFWRVSFAMAECESS